jgi:hypothetical protein
MQPYQPDDDIGGMIGRELASLRRLSNRDKHRVLLVAERVVAIQYVSSNTPAGEESGIRFRQDPEGHWAEIDHPLDPRYGPYDRPHVEVVRDCEAVVQGCRLWDVSD